MDLGFTGQLHWDRPPPIARGNVSVIPYGLVEQATERTPTKSSEIKARIGTDAKIALNRSLNLDITINPDFSQVDVDRQITNLSRFNLFFPERRQFFIENSDLFSSFSIGQVQPYFSRKIGLKDGNIIPIAAGARLSGNLNENLRIGLMNVQTMSTEDLAAQTTVWQLFSNVFSVVPPLVAFLSIGKLLLKNPVQVKTTTGLAAWLLTIYLKTANGILKPKPIIRGILS